MGKSHPGKPVLPLQGTRVVTLAVNVPGPVAASNLCEMGAQITKVEPPHGDPLEQYCPAWYQELAKGQQVVRLDLRTASGRSSLDCLLKTADVLITSSRPQSLRRLSIVWNDLHRQFPRLCHVAIVGEAAPRHNRAGHDLTYQAAAGLLLPPRLPNILVADLAGAERTTTAAIALLYRRAHTQTACHLEVALTDAASRFAAPVRHGITARNGILGGQFPGYGVYKSKDRWIAVAALEPHFWDRLKHELRLKTATRRQLVVKFRTRTSGEWQRWAEKRGLPLVAIGRP